MAGHHRQAGLGELAALKVATVQTVLGIPYELVDSHIVHNGEDVEGIQIVNEISDLKIVMLFRELNRGKYKTYLIGWEKDPGLPGRCLQHHRGSYLDRPRL